MKLQLKRDLPDEVCTLGTLFIDGAKECFTLERTDQADGKGLVSAGTYKVALSWSGHFQRIVPHLLDVPGRSEIEIHWGNRVTDTKGCILVGEEKSTNVIYHSVLAYSNLFAKLKAANAANDPIEIEITNFEGTQPSADATFVAPPASSHGDVPSFGKKVE